MKKCQMTVYNTPPYFGTMGDTDNKNNLAAAVRGRKRKTTCDCIMQFTTAEYLLYTCLSYNTDTVHASHHSNQTFNLDTPHG